ncbi:MAG: quinone-dependent dihydroorotate dehydrogenase [Bacteroidota bacterium]
MYKLFIRPLLFLFPPEVSHNIVVLLLKILAFIPGKFWFIRWLYSVKDERLKKKIFGLTFENPTGLAAGFDKDAKFFDEIACFGFGFIEIGTVTPKPQPGNDKPRLFRLIKDKALINRMGFNNDGVEAVTERLKKRKNFKVLIGGNIGKNKITSNENAIADYEYCFKKLFDYVDFFVVNVSSPNTPNLRELQDKEPLKNLLLRLKHLNQELSNVKCQTSNTKPILLKIAPDLTNEQLNDIIEIIRETKIDGVVATNTTISREELQTTNHKLQTIGSGGLSGKPLTKRSTEIIKYLSEHLGKDFPIIASGGIHSAEDALSKIQAGASLVEVYTGFIYEGPSLVKKINKNILNTLTI